MDNTILATNYTMSASISLAFTRRRHHCCSGQHPILQLTIHLSIPINEMCPSGETQTMSHIVESCPLTKLNGGLSRLHSADEDAVSWLTNYGK